MAGENGSQKVNREEAGPAGAVGYIVKVVDRPYRATVAMFIAFGMMVWIGLSIQKQTDDAIDARIDARTKEKVTQGETRLTQCEARLNVLEAETAELKTGFAQLYTLKTGRTWSQMRGGTPGTHDAETP
jgi:hypothetical protein